MAGLLTIGAETALRQSFSPGLAAARHAARRLGPRARPADRTIPIFGKSDAIPRSLGLLHAVQLEDYGDDALGWSVRYSSSDRGHHELFARIVEAHRHRSVAWLKADLCGFVELEEVIDHFVAGS